VQQAMVAQQAIQCGYCTPGIVIALAALICWIAAISLASIPAYLFLRSRHRQHERMQQQRPSHA
jgi:aerobic-type carbon monoxide dehydrogenase small subunit (CoxS/CutS family)